jgi:hypothetical protein
MKCKLTKIATFFFLLLALSATASAQTTVVGVHPGNTFNYSYSLSWSSTNPASSIPEEDLQLNNTQFIKITVLNVDGTLINVDFTRHFNNGTEITQNGNIDVDTQLLEVPYSFMIIRADANPGEKIYPTGGHSVLSDTATSTYSVGQRETIRYSSQQTSDFNSEKIEILYDQTNGVGLEYTVETTETSGTYVTTTKETMLINSWVIPEFPVTTFLFILLLTIPVLLIVYKKKMMSNHKFLVLPKQ